MLVIAEFDEVATGERTPGLLQAATRREATEIDRREAETLDELFDEGGRFRMVSRDEDHATSSVLHRPFIEAGGDDRIERLDTVLRAVTRDVLDPEVVREALDLAVRDLEQPAIAGAARLDTLKNELARVEVELNRYAEAVADAGPLETLLQAVKVREQRRDTIRSELKTLTTQRRVEPRDTSDIRATLVKYLEMWRAMAHQGVAEARDLLRAVLVGRFVFTPVIPPPDLPPRKGPGRKPRFIYELKGEASLSGLIAGLISASSVVAPTGFEPVFESRSRFRQVSYAVTDQQHPATSTRLKHAAESSLKHRVS